MYTTKVAWKFFSIRRLLILPRTLSSFEQRTIDCLDAIGDSKKSVEESITKDTNMTDTTKTTMNYCFRGHDDIYNGVTINSLEESCDATALSRFLEASLKLWLQQKKRTIWFRVHLSHSDWIPILTQSGFKFHHAREEFVTLYRWICNDRVCNVPTYAHTQLGVGAFVFNKETSEILVVKEAHSKGKPLWKLPGGYVEQGEDIDKAAEREVLEETGIESRFVCLTAFRHIHNSAFGCSDMYITAYLVPHTFHIKQCTLEIAECKWMKLEEYVTHAEVSEYNRSIARKMLEFIKHLTGLTIEHNFDIRNKRPVAVYTISNVGTEFCSC